MAQSQPTCVVYVQFHGTNKQVASKYYEKTIHKFSVTYTTIRLNR